jgi:hypothetical protein
MGDGFTHDGLIFSFNRMGILPHCRSRQSRQHFFQVLNAVSVCNISFQRGNNGNL